MYGYLFFGTQDPKKMQLNGWWTDFKKAAKKTGQVIYDSYDYVTPDIFQPEKTIPLATNPDFYSRNWDKLTSDPVGWVQDTIKEAYNNFVPDWAGTDQLTEARRWVMKETREYVKANYSEEIRQSANSHSELITTYDTVIKTPETLKEDIAVNTASMVSAAALLIPPPYGEIVAAIAGPLSYVTAKRVVDEIYQIIIRELKKALFPDQARQAERKLAMANLSDEYLSGLSLAEYDPEAKIFLKMYQPANNIDQAVKNKIDEFSYKFRSLLGMSSEEYLNLITKLDEYIYFQIYYAFAWVREFAGNPEIDEQIQIYIAFSIFNQRAEMLNKMIEYAAGKTGMAYASYMGALAKEANTWRDVIGRWKAAQSKSAWEEKMREDRARWAREASAGAAQAARNKAEWEARQREDAKTALKIGVPSIATLLTVAALAKK